MNNLTNINKRQFLRKEILNKYKGIRKTGNNNDVDW